METPSASPEPADARAALVDVETVRCGVADRIEMPWWYRVATGLSLALTFVGIGFGGTAALVGAVVGGALLPAVLSWAAGRATGISLDRYRSASATAYLTGLFVLLGLGLWVRFGLGVPWAMAVAGAAAFILTLLMEPRIDASARRALRSAR
jgi:hypothetical protein